MAQLILKRASATGTGSFGPDDFDVLADGEIVGRIYASDAAPDHARWMWTLAYGHHEGRTPTHGRAATREDAMAAFAKVWRRL